MTPENKLVEEVARKIWIGLGLDYTADDIVDADKAARAVIPLVQAALLREMVENLEGRNWVYREKILGWFRAFTASKGLEIEG